LARAHEINLYIAALKKLEAANLILAQRIKAEEEAKVQVRFSRVQVQALEELCFESQKACERAEPARQARPTLSFSSLLSSSLLS
jgi:hypothetical protein